MSWVSVATAVAGFVVQQMASEKQSDKQQQLADSMSAYKLTKSREAQAATDAYTKDINPVQREAERQTLTEGLRDQYTAGVDASKKYETPDNFAGKVSSDYAGVRDRSNTKNAQRLTDAIGQLATINAPGQRDLADARRFSTAAGNVSAANTAAENVGQSFMTGINQTRPDPYMQLAGQLLSGVATSGVLRPSKTAALGGTV